MPNENVLKENFLIFLIFLAILVSCFSVSAQTLELTCRSQAKDIAVTTYNNCMTEGRNKHIESIRGEYQQKLKELKSHYDNELKKIDAGSAPSSMTPQQKSQVPSSQTQPAHKTKKIASSTRSSAPRRQRTQVLPQKVMRSQSPQNFSANQQEAVVTPESSYQRPTESYDDSASPYPEKEDDTVDVVDIQSQE